jgi:flagellar biosynthesis/type III secretory pathway protein FliH
MPENWYWQAEETILSEAKAIAAWMPDALIHRPQELPTFMRHQWDENRLQDFGPWRWSPDADPLQGQTEALPPDASPQSPSTFHEDHLSGEHEQFDSDSAISPPTDTSLSQDQVDAMIREARESAWAEGHQAAEQAMAESIEKERLSLRELATQLNALQGDPQQWLAPMKKLAIHVAQELVRGELRLDTVVIERLIQACIDALEQPAQTTLVQVGHEDIQRLRELALPGVTLELDEALSAGSVRVKVQDTQVQDLMAHRLAQITHDILGEPGHGHLR